ncbi:MULTISPECIES: hypothetical protein [unclassified Falsihalocynthiibacter]|uniref:hypothetical protein n=1 Tax=unclassified Falsihalocynthiibacter TaxID=2854191 RepID=UPI00350FC3BE
MAFIIALILLLAFTANVAVGAIGDGPLIGNVGELLMLMTASISFVVGILQRETQTKKGAKTPDT